MKTMTCTFLDSMGNDLSVVNAARTSFAKSHTILTRGDRALIEYLATGMQRGHRLALQERLMFCDNMPEADALIDEIQAIQKHWVPFASVTVKLHIYAPIFVLRQFVRSEAGRVYSEESRRYVDDAPEMFGMQLRKRAANIKQGSSDELAGFEEQDQYNEALDFSAQHYASLIERGVAPEQARAVLPQATMTQMVVTGSLYYWANVVRQRRYVGAQQEIRSLVQLISAECRPVAPISWAALLRSGVEHSDPLSEASPRCGESVVPD